VLRPQAGAGFDYPARSLRIQLAERLVRAPFPFAMRAASRGRLRPAPLKRKPRLSGAFLKRTTGIEPATLSLGSCESKLEFSLTFLAGPRESGAEVSCCSRRDAACDHDVHASSFRQVNGAAHPVLSPTAASSAAQRSLLAPTTSRAARETARRSRPWSAMQPRQPGPPQGRLRRPPRRRGARRR
jgi:hypothetical protein